MIGLLKTKKREKTGDYVVSVPELPGCHTQAKKTPDEVMKRIKEVIQACLLVEGLKSQGRTGYIRAFAKAQEIINSY